MAILSFSTLPLHLESPTEVIRLARERGFQGVEILCEPPWHPRDWSPSLMRDVREAAEGLALSLHAPTGDVNLISRHPGARQFAEAELSRTIALAARIGASHITVHLGYRASGVPGEIPFDAAREALVRLKRRAEDSGITLCLENDPRLHYLYLWDLGEYLSWLEELGLRGTLDVGHAWTAHSDAALDFLPRLAPRIAVVHVSDNAGERDDHLSLGRGAIPLRAVLPRLKGTELWVLELMAPEGMEESRELMEEIFQEA
jgi:sugar phosphate isomerase/epimerase